MTKTLTIDRKGRTMDAAAAHENIRTIVAEFAAERRERQRRRELMPADFARLRDAGFLLTGVPIDQGGIWESVGKSARLICDMLRLLAHGDSSVCPGLRYASGRAEFLDGHARGARAV
jgi:alkylation response protein AidB-like acyl-CoA dehydrogenase